METHPTDSRAQITTMALLVTVISVAGCVQQPNVPGYSSPVTDPYASKRWSSPAFTTAHASFGDAAKHFLNVKPKPQQPIDFPHKIHTEDIGVYCQDCHTGVKTGPRAGIPSINICMSCHEDIGDPKDSRIQLLRDHAKRGEDMPWQRVYGFVEESHLRFNHSPHIRAGVDCATCHGDLTQMTVAERVVNHTMGFCIDCHKQKGASNDCLTCHY
ncbi:MAG: hypothetical protein DMG14_21010 [Acidobacteria bacterium]|nr:MAG: hypothetical protein DMG14_21010 [Acidobacteriota bacterium]